MPIRISEGLDIPIAGAPEQVISGPTDVTSVALLGNDYVGLSPAMRVHEGDRVTLGQPLFADRRRPEIVFTSPGSGVVSQIIRGARRALLSVVVNLTGNDEEVFPAWPDAELTNLRRQQVQENLLSSGLWTVFRSRPYSKIPDPEIAPHAIFVTAMDSNPLAARADLVINENGADFARGLTVISHLTDGVVFVCKAPNVELPKGASSKIREAEFSGPHPSGLPGTHIHFLDPVGSGKCVWYLGHQDVVAIGKLFTVGRLWTERIVALGGPPVKRPRLVRTRLGANLDDLVGNEIADPGARIISGSVLSGRTARTPENYLGRFHTQVSVLAEGRAAADEASTDTDGDVFSTYTLAVAKQAAKRKFALTTALHGRATAMVPLGGFERVMPLDILPTQLFRALLVGDTDMAQALGCLELDEEDLALSTYVCPSKLNYGPLLRDALERIEKEG